MTESLRLAGLIASAVAVAVVCSVVAWQAARHHRPTQFRSFPVEFFRDMSSIVAAVIGGLALAAAWGTDPWTHYFAGLVMWLPYPCWAGWRCLTIFRALEQVHDPEASARRRNAPAGGSKP